ncbi:MAG TPA: GGDEF domain-containing protein [Candidatus Dormibacteraeota bacterium]
MTSRGSSGFGDRPLSDDQLREALAASLGVDASGLALLSGREAATGLARLRALQDRVRVLDEQASTDELTGVLRRGAGMAALEREIDRARRSEARLVVAFLDVDGLKLVNDQHGHAAGDRLLCDVALVLRSRLRSYDLVMRWGGDEFVCALFGAQTQGAEHRLEAVAAGIEAATGGRTVSWGLVALEAADTAATIVGRADVALYERRRAVLPMPAADEPGVVEANGAADRDVAGAP